MARDYNTSRKHKDTHRFDKFYNIIIIGYINPSRCKLPPNTTVEEAIPVEIGQDGKPYPAQCVMYRNISVDNSTMACPAGYEYQSDGFDINDGTITIEVQI